MATGPPPLSGIKVLEFAGLAPGPFAGMLLADAGASVLRIDRPAAAGPPTADVLTRRKASVAIDIGTARGAALVRRLVAGAGVDVLIDPFRPGVLERRGLGPDALCALHPPLVYARLSGFRRDGRYRLMAGHDITYLAVSGALALLGPPAPAPPLAPANLLADFAGGGATLVLGVLLALLARHASASGRGQVVAANMVDGAAYLASFPRLARAARPRGRNLLDGGCPFYATYATRDAQYVAVGALEPRFFAALLRGLGLHGRGWEARRLDPDQWPALRRELAAAFARKTRAEWEAVFDGTDACCAPVLAYAELEADAAREGDQRPPVALSQTPCLAIKQRPVRHRDAATHGQGPGVPGDGYRTDGLAPGQGGAELLETWLGWKEGRDYHVSQGGLVLDDDKAEPKL